MDPSFFWGVDCPMSEIVCFPVLNLPIPTWKTPYFSLKTRLFLCNSSLLFKHTNWCITNCLFLSRLSLKSPASFLSLVLLNNILVEILS